MLSKNFRVKTF